MGLSLFRFHHHTSSRIPESVAALFSYLRGLINREDLIAEIWKQYQAAGNDPDPTLSFVSAYIALEEFITSHQPLVVKASYTVQSLREDIATKMAVDTLPGYLEVLFVTGIREHLLFFTMIANDLVHVLIPLVGEGHIKDLLASRVAGTPLVTMTLTAGGIDMRGVRALDTTVETVQPIMDGLYRQLLDELTTSFGFEKAEQCVRSTHERIARYGITMLPKFFAYLPDTVLATERLSYLSREDLAQKVAEATTNERKKRQEAEALSADLHEKIRLIQAQQKQAEEAKFAMLNILEDAKALEDALIKEKASVQQKVVERTAELHNEQARLNASINSLELGFLLVDAQEVILTSNKAVQGILGLPKGPANLSDVETVLSQNINLRAYHQKAKEHGVPVRVNDIIVGVKHIDFFIAPIFLSDNKVDFLGSVMILQDISDAKALERSRDEFFSIASHELRTPLTAIRGNTALIKEYYLSSLKDPALVEMVDDIHESSVRLIDIVNDFLNVGRLEQNRMVFHTEPIDISALIDATIKSYQVTGSRRNLHLTFEPPSAPIPPVFIDKDKVREVLINLIGNAMKFTIEGGITIRVRGNGDMAEVEVADTGRGIPYENQSLLFRKFTQAGDNILTRDTTRGTGLGLYISKLIIEGMHGAIRLVSSKPGQGTVFAFTVPFASQDQIAAHVQSDAPEDQKVAGALPQQVT